MNEESHLRAVPHQSTSQPGVRIIHYSQGKKNPEKCTSEGHQPRGHRSPCRERISAMKIANQWAHHGLDTGQKVPFNSFHLT